MKPQTIFFLLNFLDFLFFAAFLFREFIIIIWKDNNEKQFKDINLSYDNNDEISIVPAVAGG